MPATGFYAVANGRSTGVFRTWDECKAQVDGFPAGKYKKFKTEAEAIAFVQGSAASGSGSTSKPKAPPSVGSSKTGAESSAFIHGSAASGSGSTSRPKVPPPVGSSKRKANDSDDNKEPKTSKPKVERASAVTPPTAPGSGPLYDDDGVRVIDVYTDGASSNNGQQNLARAGWGVHWPEGRDSTSDLHGLDESRRLDGAMQTNNRAELMGIIRAIELCPDKDAKLRVYTDSKYSIQCINDWQAKWRRNKWKLSAKKDVMNRDLVRKLERLMRARKHRPTLLYVKGHGISEGNNEADSLAVAGAKLPDIPKEAWEDHEPPPSDDENGKVVKVVFSEENTEQAKARWMKFGFTAQEAEKRAMAGNCDAK